MMMTIFRHHRKMERIIAAAYKILPEFVCWKGGVLKIGTKEVDDIYQCRIGRHHAEILHIFGKEVDHETDGFYTSFGRWVDRKEAAQIAVKHSKIPSYFYIFGNGLHDLKDLFFSLEKSRISPVVRC